MRVCPHGQFGKVLQFPYHWMVEGEDTGFQERFLSIRLLATVVTSPVNRSEMGENKYYFFVC